MGLFQTLPGRESQDHLRRVRYPSELIFVSLRAKADNIHASVKVDELPVGHITFSDPMNVDPEIVKMGVHSTCLRHNLDLYAIEACG